jgi:PleD family two-component response regulator
MRILLVDDSEDGRELTEAALLSAGFKGVQTASSAWDAFRVLDLGRPSEGPASVDLVLLDIVMPEIDGIEACARIRGDANYTDVPIIMLTSLDDMDSLANAFAAGANDYVSKPVNRVELIARVRAALKLKSELERRQTRERELLAFMSNWGDRHATLWMDETTSLFVGEVAEAYLIAVPGQQNDDVISILALEIDGLEAFRTKRGEHASRMILAQVAEAVRRLAAAVGIIAAAYRNGLIVVIAPQLDAKGAMALGESLRVAVSQLKLDKFESRATEQVTASVSVATGHVRRGIDRMHLMTHAISSVHAAALAGGNRVAATTP